MHDCSCMCIRKLFPRYGLLIGGLVLWLLCLTACGREQAPSVPQGANEYVFGNVSISLPAQFQPFDSGDAKHLVSLNDGYAQVYLHKQVASDTGTDPTYFASLSAMAYGELYCDVSGLSDYEVYTGEQKNCAGFFYMLPKSDPAMSVWVYLYFIKDARSDCVWLVECRYTAPYAEYYTALFGEWDQYFTLVKK